MKGRERRRSRILRREVEVVDLRRVVARRVVGKVPLRFAGGEGTVIEIAGMVTVTESMAVARMAAVGRVVGRAVGIGRRAGRSRRVLVVVGRSHRRRRGRGSRRVVDRRVLTC